MIIKYMIGFNVIFTMYQDKFVIKLNEIYHIAMKFAQSMLYDCYFHSHE